MFPLQSNSACIQDIKKKQKSERDVTKYVSNKDNATFEETVKAP
jgi:hypothetical protein